MYSWSFLLFSWTTSYTKSKYIIIIIIIIIIVFIIIIIFTIIVLIIILFCYLRWSEHPLNAACDFFLYVL